MTATPVLVGTTVTAALAGLIGLGVNSCVAGKSVRFWRRIGVAGTLHGQARPVDAKADAGLDTDRVAALSTRRLAVTAKSLLPELARKVREDATGLLVTGCY